MITHHHVCVGDGFPEHPKLEALERCPKLYMAAITVWTLCAVLALEEVRLGP